MSSDDSACCDHDDDHDMICRHDDSKDHDVIIFKFNVITVISTTKQSEVDFSPSCVTLVALNERYVYQLVETGGLATSWAAEQVLVD